MELPQLDGPSWPGPRDVGRSSFAACTLYQMGYRQAFEPEAHHIASLLVDQMLPLIRIEVAPEDEPYLRRVFASAAQIGAGIGIVERQGGQPHARRTDRQFGGALAVAGSDLPAMPSAHRRVALHLLHCGYYVARTDPDTVPTLLDALPREFDSESGETL